MEWLNNLIKRLLSIIPRIWMVNPDEGGVRITFGRKYAYTPPGWYMYWPWVQSCIKIPVTPQVVDLRAQSVLTKDKKDMCIGGAIMYRIKDPVAAILKVQDFDKSLQVMALGIISRYIGERDYEDCSDINDIADIVAKDVKADARGWGVDIMRVYITDRGQVKNIRLLTDTPVSTMVEVSDDGELEA